MIDIIKSIVDYFNGTNITQFVSSNHNGTSSILTTKVVKFVPVKEWVVTANDDELELYKQASKNVAKKYKK
jgi:hypothetical protein